MPIYPYRCNACGFRKDVLQKMSDPALSVCPSCGAESFAKQLSAPAFQLKGTGWYATDFRDNGRKPPPAEADAAAPAGEVGGGAAGKDAGGDKAAAGKVPESGGSSGSDGKGNGKAADGKGADGKGSGASTGGGGAAPAVAPVASPAGKGGASGGTTSGGSGAS